MELLHNFPETPFASSAVTIGTFDGVHLGHQQVLKRLVKEANDLGVPAVTISFVNHPKDVLRPECAVERLCTLEQKQKWLSELGVDLLLALTFTPALREKSALEFLREVKHFFGAKKLVLGHDSRFGKGREGNAEFVKAHADELGYGFEYLDAFSVHGLNVSSTEVRKAIRGGELAQAAELLGRSYSLCGEVVKGDGRGRQLGYPTANIEVIGKCLPPFGVYAIRTEVDGKLVEGIANVGYSPSVTEREYPILEVHLLNFSGDLYGQTLDIALHHFIREEKQFSSVEALKAQIAKDVAHIST